MMTKIEILVVALVIGLMGLLSGAAVMTARAHTRDVTRLAHIRELQMGLEMYFQDLSSYPASADAIALGQALTACLSSEGFSAPCSSNGPTPYLEAVPTPPEQGLKGLSTCADVEDAYCFIANEDEYRIQFELENRNGALGVQAGLNCATEDGIKAGTCSSLTTAE
ncbi:MAG: hypothetical protein NUV56_03805 [Candidatus Uhrbacteria bacterium]|nr:hypothetical protein [Candidatus Uhrbacteria bacterium]